MLRRFSWVLWLLCLALTVCAVPVEALSLSAEAAVLMNADTGQILLEKNADEPMRIASTTKIMTALVVLENAAPDEEITVEHRHMAEGSSMYLREGETLTVQTLLYGLMLCSGNDAALALTEVCGGVAPFVEKMNEKAAALGMTNTSFKNPNGLDEEGHYSTARDMARLAAYAAEDPAFVRLCSTARATVDGRSMTNHNKLLDRIPGCMGMKTGYTKAAGRTLVSCVQRGECRLVAVTLNDSDDWADHEALYALGFSKEENG